MEERGGRVIVGREESGGAADFDGSNVDGRGSGSPFSAIYFSQRKRKKVSLSLTHTHSLSVSLLPVASISSHLLLASFVVFCSAFALRI